MASWGTERRNRFISIFIVFVLIVVAIYLFAYFSKPATCFDGKKNGDETGFDCGGSCELICQGAAVAPVIHWTRYFEVIPGIYNTVAYVENLNSSAGVDSANYIFKLYDEKNVVLTQRKGTVKIRPNEIIPIVEPALNTGKLIPVRSTFEFTDNLIWQKREPRVPVLVISNEKSYDVDDLPRISGILTNTSVYPVEKISLVAIVYDSTNNAIASSRTFFEKINKDESVNFVFTWPQKFQKPLSRFEIVPLYDTDF